MIPATTAVTAFDPTTGVKLVYDQWVPVGQSINSPDDESEAEFTPTSASVTMRRCYTDKGGKTRRLPEYVASRLGIQRDVSVYVPNIYAAPTDTGPAFVPADYPDGATDLEKARIDLDNAQKKQEYEQGRNAYPVAVKRAILVAPAEPKSLMELVVIAAAVLGRAQGKL